MSIGVKTKTTAEKLPTKEVSEPNAEALGAALQLYRLAKGLSRKEVCSELESPMNEQYLYLIESGRRRPRPALLRDLCGVLEIDLARLTETAHSARMRAASRIAAQIARLEHKLEQLLSAERPSRERSDRPRRATSG
jgi:transcriptional regulator with XRE-family HTH domain